MAVCSCRLAIPCLMITSRASVATYVGRILSGGCRKCFAFNCQLILHYCMDPSQKFADSHLLNPWWYSVFHMIWQSQKVLQSKYLQVCKIYIDRYTKTQMMNHKLLLCHKKKIVPKAVHRARVMCSNWPFSPPWAAAMVSRSHSSLLK